MAAKKKGSGGSITRSQVVTVRLDPKLKFAAELAARKQRRTISSFIEWAVEQAIEQVQVSSGSGFDDPGESVSDILNKVWDVEEADRLVKLATYFPQLLTFEEEQLWKLIGECGHFWRNGVKGGGGYGNGIYFDRVRNCWEQLNNIITGEESKETLNELSVDKPAPKKTTQMTQSNHSPYGSSNS